MPDTLHGTSSGIELAAIRLVLRRLAGHDVQHTGNQL
jgi:hypothetical protein